MRRVVSLLAAAFLFTLPALAQAQAAAAAPAVAAPAAAAPAAAAPAPAKVTITPYGFILTQGFWNDGPFSSKDGGFQALTNHDGGAFILSARGSRIGFRIGLPQDPWTGADVKGVLEWDFKAGYLPSSAYTVCPAPASGSTSALSCSTTLGTSSTSWYNSVPRVRLAYMSAAWGSSESKLTLVAGQDWGLIAPVSATSLAWGYDPLFTQAGNTWRRAPQLKASYDFGSTFGGTIAVAALTPEDSNIANASVFPAYSVDYGAGNRSRVPNFEGRAAVWLKSGNAKVFELGVSGHYDKRRYALNNLTASSGAQNLSFVNTDMDATVVAGDLVVNLPYITLQGEGFFNDGADDTINGIAPAAYAAGTSSASTYRVLNVQSRGFWAQAVLKPIAGVQIPVGYGTERLRDPKGLAASTRTANFEFSAGLLLNTSNPWKFGFEVLHTISKYELQTTAALQSATANQFALTSKLDF